tara:strand:+ start:2705 stop:2842 length:138 start_codon:yes stop_codon:yes gene_type:complete
MIIKWHRKKINQWQKKLGLSNYALAWLSYLKGLVFGLLLYHLLLK